MREFFIKMFQFGGGPEITLFSIWHFMYIVLIIGLTIGVAFLLKGKTENTKKLVLNIIAISAVIVYIADFFIMPISRFNGDATRQLIDIDKLPFHICTFIGIMIPFAQFNTKLSKSDSFKEVVACLAIVSSLMYITYPGSALGGVGTFSYKVVQTFVFHGLVFSWGFLSLSTGYAKLNFKNIWKQAIGILIIMLWATFGNFVYADYNWFFLKTSIFPFIPDSLMPLAVFGSVFAMCAIIYSIYIVSVKIANRNK
ncbi:MAG: YwaF family protein [Clostridia bacterium]|nr:YwaF family protein [Clostridia bacterium]